MQLSIAMLKSLLEANAATRDQAQSEHPNSLIRAFPVPSKITEYCQNS